MAARARAALGCAPLRGRPSRARSANLGEAGDQPGNPRSGVDRWRRWRSRRGPPRPRRARARGMAGLRRGRLRQGRSDPAGPAHRGRRGARRSRSRPARRCSPRTIPPTAPRATRPRARLHQAEEQLANLQAARQADRNRAGRGQPGRCPARRATASRPIFSAAKPCCRTGAASAQTVDQLRADFRSAEAQGRGAAGGAGAGAGADGACAGDRRPSTRRSRPRDAALAQAEWRLAQRRVTAPAAGRVADVLARPGETMAAGAPVVSLLPPENIFVRFFVPETDAGDAASRRSRRRWPATVAPPDLTGTRLVHLAAGGVHAAADLQRGSSRAKLVFLIEARPPPDQATLLNPGQPVAVRPRASRAP